MPMAGLESRISRWSNGQVPAVLPRGSVGEVGLRTRLWLTVDEHVHLLVIERDQPRNRHQITRGKVVAPGEVRAQLRADLYRPVGARPALVGARGDRIAGTQVREVDGAPIQVVAGGQACLEHHHRCARLRERDAVELDADRARGAQRIDARVRAAWMYEDLLGPLEPGFGA